MSKRLRVRMEGRVREDATYSECDSIVIELDHGRSIVVSRQSIRGEDGTQLAARIARENQTANACFAIRVPNFGLIHASVEQAK